MSTPNSFCTISTGNCANELIGLLLSLSVHHPDVPVICLVDEATQIALNKLSAPLRIKPVYYPILNEYSGKNRQQMESEGIWSTFQMMKARAIELALESYSDTLFLDSDILVTSPITVDKSKQLGLSPHYIRKTDTDTFGYYNGGVLWTSDKTVPDQWRFYTKTSRFYDQASIEDLAKAYTYFEFGEHCNISWWRLDQSDVPQEQIQRRFSSSPGKLLYKAKPVQFIHSHFTSMTPFNQLIMKHLFKAGLYKELTIIGRIMNNSWLVRVSKQPMAAPWNHTNDSFREELVLLEKKHADLKLVYDDTKNIVLEPCVMLYDRDTLRWFEPDSMDSIVKVYLGNCDVEEDGEDVLEAGCQVSPWIYWPRRPLLVEALLLKGEADRGFAERPIESLFIGNFENSVQEKFRTSQDWSTAVTEFHLTGGHVHKFSPKDYLLKLAQARYGLCLRGFGVKCHREVELMAFGTVPIVTPDVNTTSYLEPLVEGTHYIRANTPEEVAVILARISADQWQTMSAACQDWYRRNVHSDSMWKTFLGRLLYQA